jgi:hypothetical protein
MHSALGSMVDHHGRVIHLRKNVAKCQPYRACTELANCYRFDSDNDMEMLANLENTDKLKHLTMWKTINLSCLIR